MIARGLSLVGPRGTGKSTVGRVLASCLDRRFVDVDDHVASTLGLSIASIFSDHGEAHFRDAEEAAIRGLIADGKDIVLATGGGAVLRKANRDLLRDHGLVVWLTAEPIALANRLTLDEKSGRVRPSLTGAGTIAEIEAVIEARRPHYGEIADLAVDTTYLSPDEVAKTILLAFPELRR